MINIDSIPDHWKQLLSVIRAVCPTAVIAGGALRDLDNDREVKDIDIFVSARGEAQAEAAIKDLRGAGFHVSYEASALTQYPEDQSLEVSIVADLYWLGGIPVQLIFTDWNTQHICDRFDYGICRLAYDGERIIVGDGYEEDQSMTMFRLRRERDSAMAMRGSIHRYARLTAEKYAGWTWWPYEPGNMFALAPSN